jgi:hypothetical protein
MRNDFWEEAAFEGQVYNPQPRLLSWVTPVADKNTLVILSAARGTLGGRINTPRSIELGIGLRF